MILQAPYFLFGLFAIAIPVIIHLVQLRKPQRILFTNVAFIRNVENITSNQRKLKHWLILLSRILFIAFLVLVFCEPLIPASDASISKTESVKAYLDNSGSMQNEAEKGGMSLLDLAVDELKGLSQGFPKQAEIRLVDNSFKIGGNRNLTQENLQSALAGIDYSPISRKPEIIFDRLKGNDPLGNSQVFWLSDFQKSTFDPGFLSKSDTVSAITLVKLKPADASNIFIDSIWLEDELVRANHNNRILIRVFNTANEAKNGINVKLFIGNRQAGGNSVNLKPKASAIMRLEFRLTDLRAQNARLEIEDQPVTFDNSFYFTLKPASGIRILDISGRALTNTSRLFTNEPIFLYQKQEPSQVNDRAIEQAEIILVNELPDLSSGLADKLSKFVKAGGNLVFIPAEKKGSYTYSVFFQGLGLAITETNANNAAVSQLALPDLKNPFFRNIFTELDKRMQMPRAGSSLTWSRSDADLLNFKNGSKFLSQFRAGKGKVYVFSAPFSTETNEFSRHALFVPVMYKLALSSHEAEQQLAYNFNQRSFSLPVTKTNLRKSVYSLESDSASYIPEQQLRNGQMVFTIPAEMAQPGFYSLKHNDSTLTTLAFNYPKKESFIETYSAEELRQLITNKNVKIVESGGSTNFSDQFARQAKGTPLWQYFLIASLLFLLAEILLIRFL